MMVLIGQTPPPNRKPFYARSGWEIPQEVVSPDLVSLIRIRAQQLEIRSRQIRSVSDYPYNCVGMIFAARRVWIEIDHIYDVLRADHYRQIPLNQLMAGDVVLYKDNRNDPTHVALIIEIERTLSLNIRVISKWGMDAEFVHLINDVPPQFGIPVEYYTDREQYL